MTPHTENLIIGDNGQKFFRPYKPTGNLTDADANLPLVIDEFPKLFNSPDLKTIGDQQGIEPRTWSGLDGILWAPLLHGGFGHLVANTIPFLVLGAFVGFAAGSVIPEDRLGSHARQGPETRVAPPGLAFIPGGDHPSCAARTPSAARAPGFKSDHGAGTTHVFVR